MCPGEVKGTLLSYPSPRSSWYTSPMIIPIKLGGAGQDRMHLLGGGEKQLVAGKRITVRPRSGGSAQMSVVVDAVDRFGDGRLKLVHASLP